MNQTTEDLVFIPIVPATMAIPQVRTSQWLQSICRATLDNYPADGPTMPWCGYFASQTNTIVGTCAFKGAPVAGSVEIAYFTFEGHTGKGVASAMASRLVQIASAQGIDCVVAQTLPGPNASSGILSKLGFECHGERIHPSDGLVWHWERRTTLRANK